jgi:hypothetical protein
MALGEKSTITIRRFPTHVELVELHLVFPEGTRAVGYKPINVANLAEMADVQTEVNANTDALAAVIVESADDLEQLGSPYGPESRDIDEVRRSLMSGSIRDVIVKQAVSAAKARTHRRVVDDAHLAEVAAYRNDHSVADTALYYGATERQVARWLAKARSLGITYKGMRGS